MSKDNATSTTTSTSQPRPPSPILQHLLALIQDYHDFNPPLSPPDSSASAPNVAQPPPTPLEFSKQVSRSQPAIYDVSSLLKEYRASAWSKVDLIREVTGKVEVAVTPDGRADDLYDVVVVDDEGGSDKAELSMKASRAEGGDEGEMRVEEKKERVFFQPAVVHMTMEELFKELEESALESLSDTLVKFGSVAAASTSASSPAAAVAAAVDVRESITATTTSTNSTDDNNYDSTNNQASDTPSTSLPQLTTPSTRPVHYLQSQNGNLNTTTTDSETLNPLSNLFTSSNLPHNFPFAHSVLGEPEAVNIWIGDERSVTSTHRDPYENLYVVLRGEKVFRLWAPVEECLLDVQMFRTGRLEFDVTTSTFTATLDIANNNENTTFPTCSDGDRDEHFDHHTSSTASSSSSSGKGELLKEEPPRIPWVTVDPLLPRHHLNALYPLYVHSRPQTLVVKQGQMLYLPSGWYHHVSQWCGSWDDGSWAPCVAVNYWYDQDYEGEKYVMRQLVGRLTAMVKEEMMSHTS